MSPHRRTVVTARVSALLAVTLIAVACQSTTTSDPSGTLGPGAETPEAAVEDLVDSLRTGDFDAAAPLALPGQAALATLAEGATFNQVAEALRGDDFAVASNFWGGFAQGAGSFLTGDVVIEPGDTVESDSLQYQVVRVLTETGGQREVVTRDDDGYRVDLFASFAAGLAPRMVGPVERLLSAQTSDARLVLTELRQVVPSLLVAAERPGQPSDVVQSVLRLVELITRVG